VSSFFSGTELFFGSYVELQVASLTACSNSIVIPSKVEINEGCSQKSLNLFLPRMQGQNQLEFLNWLLSKISQL